MIIYLLHWVRRYFLMRASALITRTYDVNVKTYKKKKTFAFSIWLVEQFELKDTTKVNQW